jgi:hypothetical protein
LEIPATGGFILNQFDQIRKQKRKPVEIHVISGHHPFNQTVVPEICRFLEIRMVSFLTPRPKSDIMVV